MKPVVAKLIMDPEKNQKRASHSKSKSDGVDDRIGFLLPHLAEGDLQMAQCERGQEPGWMPGRPAGAHDPDFCILGFESFGRCRIFNRLPESSLFGKTFLHQSGCLVPDIGFELGHIGFLQILAAEELFFPFTDCLFHVEHVHLLLVKAILISVQ